MKQKQLYIPLVPPVEITEESLQKLRDNFLKLHPEILLHRHDVNPDGEFIDTQCQARFLVWAKRELERNKFVDAYERLFGSKQV